MRCVRMLLAMSGLVLGCLAAGPLQAATEDPPRWEADAWFDHFRPVLQPRELTPAEREEVRALLKQHLAATPPAMVPGLIRDGRPVGEIRKQATLLRLFELGESGDKEAMLAARAAIFAGGAGWGEDAPFKLVFVDLNNNNWYAETIALALTGYWTALIWDRHGPERSREARFGLESCFYGYQADARYKEVFTGRNRYVNCGFSVAVSEAGFKTRQMKRFGRGYLGSLLVNYVDDGGKPPLEIRAFYPTVGDAEFDQKRFQDLLARYRPSQQPDPLGAVTGWTDNDRAWAEHYAAGHRRERDLVAMHERGERSQADALWQARYNARMASEEMCETDMVRLSPAALAAMPGAITDLEVACAAAGDAWLDRFAGQFVVRNEGNLKRVCQYSSTSCARQQQLHARRNAEFTAELEAKRNAINNAFTGKLPSPSVNVRSYDQNGNYLGTESMTRGEAELRGAK